MKILLILCSSLLLLLSSCSLQKRCAALYPPTSDTTSFDSVQIEYKERIRDVPVYVPIFDSVRILDSMPCPDYHQKKTGKWLISDVRIQSGVLTVDCNIDSMVKVNVQLKDSLVYYKRVSGQRIKITRTVQTTKPVPFLPKIFWILLGFNVLQLLYWFSPLGRGINKLKSLWKS